MTMTFTRQFNLHERQQKSFSIIMHGSMNQMHLNSREGQNIGLSVGSTECILEYWICYNRILFVTLSIFGIIKWMKFIILLFRPSGIHGSYAWSGFPVGALNQWHIKVRLSAILLFIFEVMSLKSSFLVTNQ